MNNIEEKIIETLEKIAKSQEELVKLNEQKNIKEHVLALKHYCAKHINSCNGCPLNDPDYDQCLIRSVTCPAEFYLF